MEEATGEPIQEGLPGMPPFRPVAMTADGRVDKEALADMLKVMNVSDAAAASLEKLLRENNGEGPEGEAESAVAQEVARGLESVPSPDLEVLISPDGKEVWRNVTCPPGGRPGGAVEVTCRDRRAVLTIPQGVQEGDRFNATAFSVVDASASTGIEIATLPDGRVEWRNVICPEGGTPGATVTVTNFGKQATVTIPEGVRPGDRFNACQIQRYSNTELTVVTLPDGREEWRNIICPPGAKPGTELEARKAGKRAFVRVPDGVKEGDRFNASTSSSTEVVAGDRGSGAELEIVTLPDGREEWRNIICPPGPGEVVEVNKGAKRAVVHIPDGVKPGDRFNAIAGFTCTKYSNADLEVVTLPDGREEWRNLICPPGAPPGANLEARLGGKRAFVRVPDGVEPSDRFNAIATLTDTKTEDLLNVPHGDNNRGRRSTHCPEIEVVTLPDGKQEWRNIICPVGANTGDVLEASKGDKRGFVKVPAGVKAGDRFRAVGSSTAPATHNRKMHGPEADTRARLQRKLEQKRQARLPITVTPNQELAAADADRSSSEKKAAAKRAKKKRQKQRKRAEEAAGLRSAVVPSIEEVVTTSWSDPVPEIEEAPELDFDLDLQERAPSS